MSTNRRKKGTFSAEPQKKGPHGFLLCRWCEREVMPPKKTFCGPKCVHEWRLRTDTSYLRWCLRERDHGVCVDCGVDTEALWSELNELRHNDEHAFAERLEEVGVTEKQFWNRSTLWDADHVLPVAEGGGECDLSNLVTRCIRCHKAKTKADMVRIREAKKREE